MMVNVMLEILVYNTLAILPYIGKFKIKAANRYRQRLFTTELAIFQKCFYRRGFSFDPPKKSRFSDTAVKLSLMCNIFIGKFVSRIILYHWTCLKCFWVNIWSLKLSNITEKLVSSCLIMVFYRCFITFYSTLKYWDRTLFVFQ